MNRAEVLIKISKDTGIKVEDCEKVLDSFENILDEKISNSKGVGNAFDKVYQLMSFIKRRKDKN
ncbi:hypothetical protein O2K51_06690 [Apibacter raozihei]|uniref:hypothetical protein n=1 Tax=Apibacter TaxID=1778601 RepID=UPI000FE36DCD|nr:MULTISPECIES: hypothetical protein [Apibacter]